MRCRVLALVLLSACVYKGRIEDRYASSVEAKRWHDAVSEADGMASRFDPEDRNEPTDEATKARINKGRYDSFQKLIATTEAKTSPLTEKNAAERFAWMVALRTEARYGTKLRVATLKPLDDNEIQKGLDESANVLWQSLLKELANGNTDKFLQDGAQLVAYAPHTAGATTFHETFSALAAKHLDLAKQAEAANQIAARIYHARLARVYGADVPSEQRALTPEMVAATKLEWKVDIAGSCAESSPDLSFLMDMTHSTKGGTPAKLGLKFDTCAFSESQDAATERDMPYTETMQQRVPVESWGPSCHEGTGPLRERPYDKDGDHGVELYREKETICGDIPKKGYYGESELVDVTVHLTETVAVRPIKLTLSATGMFSIAIEGEPRTASFSVAGVSTPDDEWRGAHSQRFADRAGLKAESSVYMYKKLVREAFHTIDPVLFAREKEWQDKALAATDPFEREGLWFLSTQVREVLSNEAISGLGIRMLGGDITAQHHAVNDELMEITDYSTDKKLEIERMSKGMVETHANEYFDNVETLGFSLGVGYSQSESAIAGDAKHGGAVGAMRISLLGHTNPLLGLGGAFRFAGGYGGAGGQVDADFLFLAQLRLPFVSFGPILGLGGDFSPNYEIDTATKFGVSPGAYAELGLRIHLQAPQLLSSLDVSYTKAARTGALSAERRLDVTLSAFGWSVISRYAEYARDHNGFTEAFSNDGRFGKTWWLLFGKGM
ncbi:hypothetical protein BH11MYX2_BH11MYX2_38900 [soil metagenome]